MMALNELATACQRAAGKPRPGCRGSAARAKSRGGPGGRVTVAATARPGGRQPEPERPLPGLG